MSVRPIHVAAIVGALAALAGGCGRGPSTATPQGTLEAFADAIRDERHGRAYGLMSDGYRERVAREEFERHLRANPSEARRLAAAIEATDEPIEVTARVRYGEGEELRLARRGGRWHILGNVVDFYDQSTPRAALRSFVRAVERRRYDVVLRFVPEADREGMTEEKMREAWEGEGREEIERLLANLRANLDNPIEVVGDRATMPYGERFSVQFVREEGVWKIEDPD
ncbi:MAG: hypothetical protein ACODAU_02895 [Myxococcota bacterium]